jgi:XTP/dITP diphosphohydrolase
MSRRVVLATHNPHKVEEFAAIVRETRPDLEVVGYDGPEPVEDGVTFAQNALIKARAAAAHTGLPALADDSGLSVAALDGRPGVYTADWAERQWFEGPAGRDWYMAMGKVEGLLQAKGAATPRDAWFSCVLALAWPDGHVEWFEGRVDGQLVWPPRGEHGFGYDPMFVPDGHDRTFGEMTHDEKTPLTHRAAAFKQLVDAVL